MTLKEFIKAVNVEDFNKEIKLVDTGDFDPITRIEITHDTIEIHAMVERKQYEQR